MTPLQVCLSYLDSLGIVYSHSSDAVKQAEEVAGSDLVPGYNVVQTVVLKGDSQFLLVVVPAESYVELAQVRSAAGTSNLRFATEAEVSVLFPFGEVERVPPLGGLAGSPVYLDSALAERDSLAFYACTKHDLINMKTADFQRLARTQIGLFSATDYQKEFRHRLLASAQKAGK